MSFKEFRPNQKLFPAIAKVLTKIGKCYHDYEIRGLEHVPLSGGGLIVLYHGLVPLDFYYFGTKLYLETGRHPCALADSWVMRAPILGSFAHSIGAVEASREAAVARLRGGELVGVSPGGVREAIAGKKNHYKLIWGKRVGFAQLAIDAGVPIIPGFTQNVEGLYMSPFGDAPIFQKLYEKTRLPIVPVMGLGPFPFPVKLTTWLGEPILANPDEAAPQLAARTKAAIEELIRQHQ